MARTFSCITWRSWETGTVHCRKVMQWNSKLYKDQKGHKHQTYRNQHKQTAIMRPAGWTSLPAVLLRTAVFPDSIRPASSFIITPWTTNKLPASCGKRHSYWSSMERSLGDIG